MGGGNDGASSDEEEEEDGEHGVDSADERSKVWLGTSAIASDEHLTTLSLRATPAHPKQQRHSGQRSIAVSFAETAKLALPLVHNNLRSRVKKSCCTTYCGVVLKPCHNKRAWMVLRNRRLEDRGKRRRGKRITRRSVARDRGGTQKVQNLGRIWSGPRTVPGSEV